ncbi:MAG: YchJ family metal-binding protein [Hyphomicrobiaceae bacterium]|nr:YchJ family metal-binding protein [Hyphomicrobiaceae bacterium]
MRCPCRKKSETLSYEECCGPLHAGTMAASTAEALMRSRYAAFAMKDAAYLLATWHPSTRPARIDFTPGQEWLLLRIVAASTVGDKATVEFIARSRVGNATGALHEVSRFVREGGRWLYVDGDLK